MSGGGEVEFLSGGPEREPRPPRGPLFGGWRPPPLVTVVLVAVVAGAVWAGYLVTAPRIPSVHLTQLSDDQRSSPGALTPWQPMSDGRPAAGVQLTVNAVISAPGRSGDRITVLGMSGPGITATSARPAVLTADHPTSAVLVAQLDCRKVRLPVRAADYRLQLQAAAGSRTTAGSVAGGTIAASWATYVERSCGSWLARKDLTVLQASGTADPGAPSADLALTIDNAGDRPAYLGLGWAFGSITVTATSPAETVVAARTRSTLHLHLDVGACDAVPPLFAADGDFTTGTTSDYLGIAAMVGTRPPAANPDLEPKLDGDGPTGIVMAPGAKTAVARVLRAACADLNQFVTLIAPSHGFTLDPKTGVLTVRINIDGTPGKVNDVVLISDPGPADNTAYQPLWTSFSGLVPDSAGQVTATLTYHVPATSPCPSLGAWIPGFTLLAHVPVDGHVKTLRYGQYVDPSQDTGAIDALCNF